MINELLEKLSGKANAKFTDTSKPDLIRDLDTYEKTTWLGRNCMAKGEHR